MQRSRPATLWRRALSCATGDVPRTAAETPCGCAIFAADLLLTACFVWFDRPSHSPGECARLLNELLEPAGLLGLFAGANSEGSELVPAGMERADEERVIVELIGQALWDVFSNNHTVIDADGTAYDLGSFRASAGFIADSIKQQNEQFEDYEPSEAVRRQLEGESHADQLSQLRERLDREFEEDVARARNAPLPATVDAYRDVFGAFPEGWPHPDM